MIAPNSSAASSTQKINTFPITEEELGSLEAESTRNIHLKEFIPLASIDPVYFENTHYLALIKAARSLTDYSQRQWLESGRVAIAEPVSRGKEQLVLIRPYRKGLVLHTMYYTDEIRDFKLLAKAENVKISEKS